jgi:hypothetical protein
MQKKSHSARLLKKIKKGIQAHKKQKSTTEKITEKREKSTSQK